MIWLFIAYAVVSLMLFGALLSENMPDNLGEWIITLLLCLLWPFMIVMALGALLAEKAGGL